MRSVFASAVSDILNDKKPLLGHKKFFYRLGNILKKIMTEEV